MKKKRYGCPNKACENYQDTNGVIRDGKFKRRNDSRIIQRYKCKNCGVRFSNATFSLAAYQKKRRINKMVEHLLSSSVSKRRAAIILGVNRKTIDRRVHYLSERAQQCNQKLIAKSETAVNVQIDDLITIEHTKLKPLTVSIVVDTDKRRILGAKVSQIPAFGLLAEKSVKKYGYRKSMHRYGLEQLLKKIKPAISSNAHFKSDEHKLYPQLISKYFPDATHETFKGGRGCVAGQGELKKLVFDPIFTINHTCAMFRANINNLVRKTWCTTKKPENLQKRINIFINYYNTVLTG